MALVIVTGGTTGLANGTAVSSGTGLAPIVFSALSPTTVAAHMRSDANFYTADQTVTLPAQLEISFNGGTNWYGSGTNPNSVGADVEDVNFPILLRQITGASVAASTFSTDGTYNAITALAQVTGLTATRTTGANVDLSWGAVTNRTYYKIERATNSGFTTGLTTLSSTATATTYSDATVAAGTVYYYRVSALGTGRYSDGAVSSGVACAATVREPHTTDTLLYFVNENTGTNVDDKNTSANRDGTLTAGSGSWLGTGASFGDACYDFAASRIALPLFGAGNSPGRAAAGTFEFLLKLDTNGQQILYIEDVAGPTSWFNLQISATGKLQMNSTQTGPTSNTVNGATTVTTGVWHHVAFTWDASSQNVYLDGVLDGTAAQDGQTDQTGDPACFVGDRSPASGVGVDGKIEYFRIWASKRSAAQLLASKQAMLG